MKTFHDYLWVRMPLDELVVEVSELFPRASYNELFQREVDRLLATTSDEEARQHLEEFRRIDVVGYLDRSLRRAGFHPNELDPIVQDLVVKLLMGSFFRGWKGQSLVGRFKLSTTNFIRSLAVRTGNRRKRYADLPADPPDRESSDQEVIYDFRNFLRLRFGEVAVRVLDHRLEGDADTKDLIGQPGLESSYKLKQAVMQIKSAVRLWASNDPILLKRIERLLSEEKRTQERRLGRAATV